MKQSIIQDLNNPNCLMIWILKNLRSIKLTASMNPLSNWKVQSINLLKAILMNDMPLQPIAFPLRLFC